MYNRTYDLFIGNEGSDDLSYTGGAVEFIENFRYQERFDTYIRISVEYVSR